MRLGGLCTLVLAGTLSLSNAAMAAPAPHGFSPAFTCTGGTSADPNVIPGGTWASITVQGVCYVAAGATITVGNVYVLVGATLDAQSASTINVGQNITAFPGSTLELGCNETNPDPYLQHPCDYGTGNSTITVHGNVIALDAFFVSLVSDSVNGNVLLIRGGEHTPDCTNADCAVNNWPIKLDTIGGSVIVQGVTPDWIGVLYNNIGGSVVLNNITVDTGVGADPPAENINVGHNTIGGNLFCYGLLPDVIGGFTTVLADNGGPANVFSNGGMGYGQCKDLTLIYVPGL